MKIGMIGLGRMGMNMVRRLLRGGHEVIAYNRSPEKTEEIAKEGAVAAFSLSDLVEKLPTPRVAWMMLPAGQPVDDHLLQLKEILAPGDIVIDGGNTYYKDDIRRAESVAEKGIRFMDVGVSGGIWGLKIGYCLMIGGTKETYRYIEPVFKTLAPKEGYLYCGPTGAGHFVKMVHNGIEYGMMQAYGEGFQILEASPYAGTLNYAEVSHLWNQGSVVRSWLLELAEAAFSKDRKLSDIQGVVEDSGEGRWTVNQAIETGVSAPVITLSLMNRFRSRDRNSFSDRVLAALRREFGGHSVVTSEKK
jgi:6-phosphogluconate dehydrogenase